MLRATASSLLLACVYLGAQSSTTYIDPRWSTVGAGTLAQRPITCQANRQVYLCTGAGCTSGNNIHYCTAANTWTAQGAAGGTGITVMNGLNGANQTFATGTTGTNFNIVSAGTSHTFHFPDASGTNRGLLTSADWTTFNGKESALTFTGASGVTRTVNTVACNVASGSVAGCLSTADWTTFNGKYGSGASPTFVNTTTASITVNAAGAGYFGMFRKDAAQGATDCALGVATSGNVNTACFTGAGVKIPALANVKLLGADSTGYFAAAVAADVVSLFNSGTCSGYLKSDGTCDTPAGGSAGTANQKVTILSGASTGSVTYTAAVADAYTASVSSCSDSSGNVYFPAFSSRLTTGATITIAPAVAPADINCTVNTSGSALPDQTGNGGKVLSTNGTTASWVAASAPGAHATTHVTGGTDVIANAVAGGNAGLMSGADKTKLDGVAAGAEVNVNADWNAVSGDAQILNKPTLPSGAVVGTTDTQTLTNKSISGAQITSAVATATALAANGTNCSAGSYPLGVDASGNAESCTAVGASHTQNTDTGTTITSFQVDSGNSGPRIKNNAGTLEVRNAADGALAPLRASSVESGDGTVAGESSLKELASNGTDYISWLVPDAITNTLRLKFPNADPTAGQVLSFGVPSSNISTGAWMTPAPLVSPSFTTPALGVATATSVNKVAITAPATSATLTIANGGTLQQTGAFTLNLTATADSTPTFPAGTKTLMATDTAVADAQLPAKQKTWSVHAKLWGTGTSFVIQDTDDEASIWRNEEAARTITKVVCQSDTGTPTIMLRRNDGSVANMFSASMTCATSPSGTDGTTGILTSFVSGENAIAVGHMIDHQTTTAGGSAHWVAITISGTID